MHFIQKKIIFIIYIYKINIKKKMSDKIKAGDFKVKINWIIFKCPVNLKNNI